MPMSNLEDSVAAPANEGPPVLTPLETLRHSAAHIMADAVQRLFPEAKVTIGPHIESGFYYDFDVPRPFSDEDLPRIEQRRDRERAHREAAERKINDSKSSSSPHVPSLA